MSECKHARWTGYANNVGGYDYHCNDCGELLWRESTQLPPTRRRTMANGTILIEEAPVRSAWNDGWEG